MVCCFKNWTVLKEPLCIIKICIMKTLEFMQSRKQRISISLTLSKRLQNLRKLNHMKFKNLENWSNCFPKITLFKTIWHVVLRSYQILHYQHLLVRKYFRERLFISFVLFKAPGRNLFSYCCSHQVVHAINFPSKIKTCYYFSEDYGRSSGQHEIFIRLFFDLNLCFFLVYFSRQKILYFSVF